MCWVKEIPIDSGCPLLGRGRHAHAIDEFRRMFDDEELARVKIARPLEVKTSRQRRIDQTGITLRGWILTEASGALKGGRIVGCAFISQRGLAAVGDGRALLKLVKKADYPVTAQRHAARAVR